MHAGIYVTCVIGVCNLLMVLGVPQATSIPIVRRQVVTGNTSATDWQQKKYSELSSAIRKSQSRERLIEDFQVNAHCPFQIFYRNDVIEILCDRLQMKKCTGDLARCEDISDNCHQAYANVPVSRPSNQVGRRGKGNVPRVLKVGCIYHPKVIGLSVEANDIAHPHTVV
jgi:ribosomal protein S12